MRRLGTFLAIAVACGIACGGQSAPDFPEPSDGSSDTPDPNPQCPYEVYRHNPNSWELSRPVITFVFWGGYWDTTVEAQQHTAAWTYLFNDQQGPLDRLSEYGVSGGIVDSVWLRQGLPTGTDGGVENPLPDDKTSVISDTLNAGFEAGALPPPGDTNDLYVVYLPPHIASARMIENKWIGYHASSAYGNVRYAYAVISYGGFNATTSLVSHEVYEAATNPGGDGFYDDAHGEVGDLCQGNFDNVAGYNLQKAWSESACRCE